MNHASAGLGVIRGRDCPIVPWKNGMGTTREIAVQPSKSDTEDFLWRVSVAEVNSAAPFSAFPGIDRHIVLLDGAGFRMTLDGERTYALDTPFAPFAFAGESTVAVALVDGATRDFNLMLRRAEARGEVAVLRESGIHGLDPAAVLVYVARGGVDVGIDACGTTLLAGDAFRVDCADAGATVTLHDASVALLVRVWPKD
jgi:environmental stress-induced protein Ves